MWFIIRTMIRGKVDSARLMAALVALCAIGLLQGMEAVAGDSLPRRIFNESAEAKSARLAWWTHDRFGMFIHFGLYALPARGEWIKELETIPEDRYDVYFRHFNPNRLDARKWARAAKEAGMKYAVLTTKHHDGFCLFDSKFTDYKVTKTPFGRDIVREFVDAFRAEGIRIGFYYSLMDWHHPQYAIDVRHPRRPKTSVLWGVSGDSDADFPELNRNRDMAKYRQYMKDQVTELLTEYGPIDVIWFDMTYPGPNGKSAEDWGSVDLLKLVRKLRPEIIVNNRLGLEDTEDGWDFVTPEQFRVADWPTVGGKRVPWETCQTFSGSWGYNRDQTTWKASEELISLLVHSVSKGGNLIMNVGPTARGEFDERALASLGVYARWMQANAESVYGCTEAPARFKAPPDTVLTYNPKTNRLYIHLTAYHGGELQVDFGDEVEYAQFLHDGSELTFVQPDPQTIKKHYRHGGEGKLSIRLPDVKPPVVNPVVEVFLKSSN